ncbi:MAG: hypothetical protein GX416_02980 [Bacteroidales bacterium]|nr:hypothetical protein [Bacteroidales bacterium]
MKHIHYNYTARAIFTVMAFLLFSTQIKAQFTITESFKKSSIGSNIILGGQGTSSSHSNPFSAYLTSGNVDPVNQGWLRLTDATTNLAGYAYINTSFPSTLGVNIEFEYKSWRDINDNYNGADGFSVFLFDAKTSFQIGADGGSLGYAQKTGQTGLPGGYIGIGIDEYGNYGASTEGKTGGLSGSLIPNAVTLRGTAASGWKYLTSTGSMETNTGKNSSGSVDYNSTTTTQTRPDDATFYRKVKITIVPIGGTPAKYKITAFWTTTSTGNYTQLLTYTTTDPIPDNLKLGFSASTGGGVNYHEIRNLIITTPGGVSVQKSVDNTSQVLGGNLTYTVNVVNDTSSELTGLMLNDTIRDGKGNILPPEGFSLSSITFNNKGNIGNTAVGFTSGTPNTTGLTNPFQVQMNMAANSEASFTIIGKIGSTMPGGGIINNSVGIDPSATGITDTDQTNNYFNVSTTVLNPNLDLAIQKGVDNNGVARASGNTFTITVSNLSSIDKPDNQTVSVNDVIPTGLTVTNATGTGWTVAHIGNNYTFTRTDILKSMYAYPSITINVTPSTGYTTWTNNATLNYATDTNPANNSSSTVLKWYNYWYGTNSTDWNIPANWTANFVPNAGEDVEFATADNNGINGYGNGKGAAVNDLYLDNVDQNSSGGRIIGNLINASDKNLVITTGNQLIINGEVIDNNANKGTIVVKADSYNKATNGTLIFSDPTKNQNVAATVEFYNKAYYCDECGLYRKQWQYFGIPIQSSATFPVDGVAGNETVNQWAEVYNGDKWRTAPYTPDVQFTAFRGYEMTNDSHTLPTDVYSFPGTLYVGNATISLTKTANVNYSGANLIGNSYTAAIPIATALTTDITDKTVYLFNTGTRDQWRRLNGSQVNVSGIAGGQYLAVPFNLAGQTPGGSSTALPSMIPATHAFMLLADKNTTLNIDYSKLTKNQTITDASGNQIATRAVSADTNKASTQKDNTFKVSKLASLVMDVVSDNSADRVWIFSKSGTTYGFDSGWDGQKMGDESSAQLYVSASDNTKLQVATVPNFDSVSLGFIPTNDGTYTLEFAPSDELNNDKIYLNDLLTGKRLQIVNGGTYTFTATKGETVNRFSLSYTAGSTTFSSDESLIHITIGDGTIKITNTSNNDCSVFISDNKGYTIKHCEVQSNSEKIFSGIANGTYIVRLQNAIVNDMRRITLGN